MSMLLQFALAVCLIILAGGVVHWVNTYLRQPSFRAKRAPSDAAGSDELAQRLAEIERRLTDVQDVMIALSEKFDRWDAAGGGRPTRR